VAGRPLHILLDWHSLAGVGVTNVCSTLKINCTISTYTFMNAGKHVEVKENGTISVKSEAHVLPQGYLSYRFGSGANVGTATPFWETQ